MSEMEHFVNLNCANCGAKLEVYDDMERFACGYCGTEMVAQRRGGTVTLKAVTDAIKQVQVGTDKTAAELALARLNQEASRLNGEMQRLVAHFNGIKNGSALNVGCATVFAALMLIGFVSMVSHGSEISGVTVALVVGGIAWAVTAWSPKTSRLRAAEKQITDKQAEIQDVQRRISEQRRIVDAVP